MTHFRLTRLGLCLALLVVASCTRVPRSADGKALVWCIYTEDPFAASPLNSFYDDVAPDTPIADRSIEGLLEELDFQLSRGGRIDHASLPQVRLRETPEQHRKLQALLDEPTYCQLSADPYTFDRWFVVSDRRFGISEDVHIYVPDANQSGIYGYAGFANRDLSEKSPMQIYTTIEWGSPIDHSVVEHYPKWEPRWIRIYKTGISYNGPLWISMVILGGIGGAFLFILRRPLMRVFKVPANFCPHTQS